MRKFILFIFVIFISSNVYGADINFSNNNGHVCKHYVLQYASRNM